MWADANIEVFPQSCVGVIFLCICKRSSRIEVIFSNNLPYFPLVQCKSFPDVTMAFMKESSVYV